jgi:hypothetical protein
MNTQEILSYFGSNTVYKFNGTLQELKLLQETNNNSYNYLLVADVIYVIAQNPIMDNRATIFTGE